MVMRDAGITILAAVVLAALLGFGAKFFTKTEDSVVEEIAEEIIEQHTGLDVDLSPDSPE